MEIDIYDAQHPSRKKAIKILEELAEKLGDDGIFDDDWYGCEDLVTFIVEGKED